MALTAMDLVAAAKAHIREVTSSEALARLDSVLVLDVREPAEFAAGCLPGAINIPRGVLEFQIGNRPEFSGDKNREVLIYCLSGGRSALAAETLQNMGYGRVSSLAGGFNAWQQAGSPVVRPG